MIDDTLLSPGTDDALTAGHTLDDHEELGGYDGLGEIARAMHVESGELDDTLDAIVHAAVSAVDKAEDAGLILITKGQLQPVKTTSVRPHKLDVLQREVGSGPCFDAAVAQQVMMVDDLTRDPRWSALHEAAAELGVRSLACVPLRVGSRTTGALTLYNGGVAAFRDVDLGYVGLFATLAALALAEAQRADQLRSALDSRDTLGQAKGILIERLRLSPDAAFAVLAEASQRTNTKVTAVAEHLVRTGELVEPGSRVR